MRDRRNSISVDPTMLPRSRTLSLPRRNTVLFTGEENSMAPLEEIGE